LAEYDEVFCLFAFSDFEPVVLRSIPVLYCSIVCCILAGTPIVTTAGHAAPPSPGCHLKPTMTGTVTRVVDNQTIRLSDGSALHLAGVLAPTALDSLAATPSWPPERQTLHALEDLVLGRNVGIALTERHRDRYGRQSGHVFVGRGEQSRWLQAELVALGSVRVDVTALAPRCARVLLALEARTRHARSGLWSHAAYRIRDAKQSRRLLRYRSTYQIVEGRVHKVARVGKRIYINFDQDWRTDFTIGLTTRTARRLGLTQARLTELEGRRVRSRGWIERRGGPFIYLTAMAQLELLDDDDPPPSQPQRKRPYRDHHSSAPFEPRQSPSDTDRKQNRPAVSPPGGIDL
jgi:endonuclease YncB( thermonuclease family)